MDQPALFSGQRLGHYTIEEQLGAGGMGVVYRAFDTRLDRPVAIKVLRPETVRDEDRKQRFVREAKAASALNHPNIITIYAIEESGGLDYIVMEYVPGQTLEVLLRSPLELRKVIDYALQISSALARAHSAEIVHRDIKPDNMIVSDEGHLKVLDFGLAKLTGEKPRSAEHAAAAAVPTPVTDEKSAALTIPGTTMGTLAYMSPEQARGETLDARTDLFAFGAVLYEMATGKRAFSRLGTRSVIDEQPEPPSRVNPSLPSALERIILKALEKRREQRYQSTAEMQADLQRLKSSMEGSRLTRPAIIAALGFAVLTLVIAFALLRKHPGPRPVQFTQLTDLPGRELFPSLSPDGKMLAFQSRVSGKWDIYVQPVSGGSPTNLTPDASPGNSEPAFSPDGQSIAFRSGRDGGGIFIMTAAGQSPHKISDSGFNPAWSPDGREIVFDTEDVLHPESRYGVSQLWAVEAAAGRKRMITSGDAVQPNWSPHGNRIAYWSQRAGQSDLWTIAADGTAPVRVTDDKPYDWNPVWSPDGKYLYFSSNRGGSMNLWRIAIDEKSGRVLGVPEPLNTPSPFSGHMSISRDGKLLAFAQESGTAEVRKVLFDPVRASVLGAAVPVTRGTTGAGSPDVSPDGNWLAFISPKLEHIYIARTDGTGVLQVTDGAYKDRFPRWSPDGKRLAFYSNHGKGAQAWIVNSDGTGLQQVTDFAQGAVAPNWSPDGVHLVYSSNRGQGAWIMDLRRPWSLQEPQALPAFGPPGTWFEAWSWSHDGQRIAGHRLSTNGLLSGVAVYDLRTGKYDRLTDFGNSPAWLKDDRRLLFYREDRLYLVDSVSRKTELVLSVAPYHITWTISVAPDNQTIYFSLVMDEADIWLARLE